MAALQIKNIPTGAGDDIKFDATWAKGDTKNVISTSSASPNFLMVGRRRRPAWSQSKHRLWCDHGRLSIFRSRLAAMEVIHLTTAYGVRGAFNHNWDPYWSSSLFGGMGWVRYDATAQANYCAAYAVGGLPMRRTYSCNPNYSISELGFITRWTPVKNLTFSAETIWAHLDTGFTGTAVLNPGATTALPTTTYAFKTRTPCPSTFAFSATSDPDRLTHSKRPPAGNCRGFFFSGQCQCAGRMAAVPPEYAIGGQARSKCSMPKIHRPFPLAGVWKPLRASGMPGPQRKRPPGRKHYCEIINC